MAFDFAFFHAVIIACEKVVDKQIVVGQYDISNQPHRYSQMKITLDREEVQNILITYLESLLPNTKFNTVKFECSNYAFLYRAEFTYEKEDTAE